MCAVGIPDDQSYRRSQVPSGHATGWRRRLMVGILVAVALVVSVPVVIRIVGNSTKPRARTAAVDRRGRGDLSRFVRRWTEGDV